MYPYNKIVYIIVKNIEINLKKETEEKEVEDMKSEKDEEEDEVIIFHDRSKLVDEFRCCGETEVNDKKEDVQRLIIEKIDENKSEIKKLNDKIDKLLEMNTMSNYISMGIVTVGVTAITALFAYYYVKSGKRVDLKKGKMEKWV